LRYFIDLSYNGSAFNGWQTQQNATGVQDEINAALSKLVGEKVVCTGSGRTDTGVHAIMQIAHFDGPKNINIPKIRFQLNGLLPKTIAINEIYPVKNDSNARYSAILRAYLYKIHQKKDPFTLGLSYFFPHHLDVNKMNDCCKRLLHWNDYQCFCKSRTNVKSFECNIFEANWQKNNDQLVFNVTANRFLRGMVRAMVGTMLDAGTTKISADQFQDILESKSRDKAGYSVPAHGLYLQSVKYPQEIYLK